ncbi:hypothetical protein KIH41_15125 [Litoribacter ruber]|uniref:hypothetical protein n=1 Tax=Litoribacter ruber TaxID=702568 RepID=UPI001BD98872|nr:hypothetical protein [Litoribacter ruber]MBT0812619.1 hypothetical protein [Litoribacter ruber]
MTGGAGFAKQGKDQFDDNRKLRQIRTPYKDQAYQKDPRVFSGTMEVYEELKDWQNDRRQEIAQTSMFIWSFIVMLILSLLAVMVLLF